MLVFDEAGEVRHEVKGGDAVEVPLEGGGHDDFSAKDVGTGDQATTASDKLGGGHWHHSWCGRLVQLRRAEAGDKRQQLKLLLVNAEFGEEAVKDLHSRERGDTGEAVLKSNVIDVLDQGTTPAHGFTTLNGVQVIGNNRKSTSELFFEHGAEFNGALANGSSVVSKTSEDGFVMWEEWGGGHGFRIIAHSGRIIAKGKAPWALQRRSDTSASASATNTNTGGTSTGTNCSGFRCWHDWSGVCCVVGVVCLLRRHQIHAEVFRA